MYAALTDGSHSGCSLELGFLLLSAVVAEMTFSPTPARIIAGTLRKLLPDLCPCPMEKTCAKCYATKEIIRKAEEKP